MTATTDRITRAELDDLTERQARLLAWEFAERLLAVYENIFPKDERAAEGLEATRQLLDLPESDVIRRLNSDHYRSIERRVCTAVHGADKISRRRGRYLTMTIAMVAVGAVRYTFLLDAREAAYRVCGAYLDIAGLQSRWEPEAEAIAADEIRARLADILDGGE